jgi:hypothetical protein
MALFPGVKRPGRKADHSPPSSAEVEKAWSYTFTLPQYVFMEWCLVKHRENFILISYISFLEKVPLFPAIPPALPAL